MVHPKRIEPGPGQESVWDYPRPPALEPARHRLEVRFAGTTVAATDNGLRVLETSHPPTYYLPPSDIMPGLLRPAGGGGSFCEWKGSASYFDVVVGDCVAARSAWTYRAPTPGFASLADHVAFYVQAMDECLVDGEVARPQGHFYGGWITSHVSGPFKGPPGTEYW